MAIDKHGLLLVETLRIHIDHSLDSVSALSWPSILSLRERAMMLVMDIRVHQSIERINMGITNGTK
jgi:hypothetical protein